MVKNSDKESIHPKSQKELRNWLLKHHSRTSGLWLISYKQSSGKERVPYTDIVDELLCLGWIDSKPNSIDEERSKLWISPRHSSSGWSKINKEKIARLMKDQRMHTSGLDKVKKAKKDGTWDKLDAIENLEIPLDLELEFKKYQSANAHFEAFPRSVKKSILEWIINAKKNETRLKRIEETAKSAEINIRANQWRK